MKHTNVVAKALLQASDKRVLLIRRSKTDSRRPLQWDLPGGEVDEGEDFTSAVLREINEEVGVEVEKTNVQLAYTLTEMTEHGNTCWLFYIGTTGQTDIKLSYEHDMFQWVSLEEATQMITYKRQQKLLKHVQDNNLFA